MRLLYWRKRQRKNRNRSVQQSGISEICFPAESEKPLYSDGRTHPHFASDIFSRHVIKSKSLIRIVRSADIDAEEENIEDETDYRAAMEKLLRARKRLRPVKMEFSRLMDPSVIAKLCEYLHLNEAQVFHSEAPLSLSFVSQVRDLLRKIVPLFYPRRVPQRSCKH